MSGTFSTGSPVLVRKLARKRHWGSADQPVEQRTTEILANVFPDNDKPYSVYQVSTEIELDRVALALNAGRDSLSEDCSFALFTPAELQAANIPLTHTAGKTPCHHANHLHFDADAAEPQLRSLITQAVTNGRDLLRRTKRQMKHVVAQATKDQCRAAVPSSTRCQAPGCPDPGS